MFLQLFLQLARDVPVKEIVRRVGLGKQPRKCKVPIAGGAIVQAFPAVLDPRRITHVFGVNGHGPSQCELRSRCVNGGLAPASAALLLWWLSLRWCAQFKRAGPGQRIQVCQGGTRHTRCWPVGYVKKSFSDYL